MSGDVHAGFCESRGVRLPPATHLVVVVAGTRAHAESLRDEVAAVLRPMGLRLSEEKTTIVHIEEGFDFLVATRGRTVGVGSLIGGSGV